MQSGLKGLSVAVGLLLLVACSHKDLRTDLVLAEAPDAEERGRAIIDRGYEAMGMSSLQDTELYSVTANFDWKQPWRLMPMNGLPGNHHNDIRFTFATATFDGRVEFLEGARAGTMHGLQSWQGYSQKSPEHELREASSAKHDWTLSTYHYLNDMPLMAPSAELVAYAGTGLIGEQSYDLVYVTWGSLEPNKQYDRMMLYYNADTHFLDLAEVTINDFYLPMPPPMRYATVQFERSITEVGAYLPHQVTIQLGDADDLDSYVYRYSLTDYAFDEEDIDVLYPLEGLHYYGASKPEED